MGDIPLRAKPGDVVFLSDVATPKDSSFIQTNIVRVNGKRQVYIPIYRQLGASTLKVVDNLRDNVLPTLSKHAGNAFIIMVANPADVLTYQAAVHGAFPSERVIGTGTLLDSTRLRSLLADRLKPLLKGSRAPR